MLRGLAEHAPQDTKLAGVFGRLIHPVIESTSQIFSLRFDSQVEMGE